VKTKIRMANGDQFEADEDIGKVVGRILSAAKKELPMISIPQAYTHPTRDVWLNPTEISSLMPVEN
jgi:hypothetical protein